MGHYYNEFDRGAAAWLRESMRAGLIPEGEVDERSITDVSPSDIRGFHAVHFFAGIGGWPLALRLAGWPDDRPVWSGSCPCQPYSAAGKGKGDNDPRNLWPAMFRLLRECCPVVCFGEQVEGAVKHGWLDRVSADLEGEGYAVGSVVLGAHSVGSPHIRQRLFWVADAQPVESGSREQGQQGQAGIGRGGLADGGAFCARGLEHPASDGRQQGRAEPDGEHADATRAPGGVADSISCGRNGRASHEGRGEIRGDASTGAGEVGYWSRFDLLPCRDGKARRTQPGLFPLVNGLPGRVGLLRGAGNAICPQTAAAFVQAYREVTE